MNKWNLIVITICFVLVSCSEESIMWTSTSGDASLAVSRDPDDLPPDVLEGEEILEEIEYSTSNIMVHKAGAGWLPFLGSMDIMATLEGNGDIIFNFTEKELDAGHYTMFRIFLEGQAYITISGVQHPLRIPGVDQTGIKIPCNFSTTGGNVAIRLDFNLDKSLGKNSEGYFLKPVIKCIVEDSKEKFKDKEDTENESCIDMASIPENWCEGEMVTNYSEEMECVVSVGCINSNEEIVFE